MHRDSRLYLRIDDKLKQAMLKYAKRHHTTLTDVVTRVFMKLLEDEKRRNQPPDAPQI